MNTMSSTTLNTTSSTRTSAIRKRRRTGVIAGLCAVLAIVGLLPRSAAAHARLVSSSPAANAVLVDPPTHIELTFDESVVVELTSIELFDESGTAIELGAVQRQAADTRTGVETPDTIGATVPTLADGLYVVSWRTSSADSHVIVGAFAFQVGNGRPIDSSALIDRVRRGSTAGAAVDALDTTSRIASLAATIVLLGALAVAAARHTVAADSAATRRLLGSAAAVAAAAAIGVLASFALRLHPGWSGLQPRRLGDAVATRTGALYTTRIAAAGVLAVLVTRWRHRGSRWWTAGALLAGAATVLSFSATGHPSAEHPSALWITVDVIHLAAVGWWIGGLVLFTLGGRQWFTDGRPTVEHYSRWTVGAVALIVVTGVAQTLKLTGSWDDVTATAWGRYLLLKVAAVVVLVSLGAVSRWMLTHVGAPSIRRNVIVEALIGALVIVAAGLMIGSPPESTVAARPFSSTVTSAGVVADIAVGPGAVGSNEIHVVITPPGGNLRPVVNATARATPLDGSIATGPIPLNRVGPNHYSGSWVVPSAGTWRVELLIDVTATNSVSLSTEVIIPG